MAGSSRSRRSRSRSRSPSPHRGRGRSPRPSDERRGRAASQERSRERRSKAASRSRSRSRERRSKAASRSRSRSRSRSADRRRTHRKERRRSRSKSRSRSPPARKERKRSPSRSRSRSPSRSPPARSGRGSDEERRLRKLEKKRRKEERKAREMQMNEVMGYSNVQNPYGDANLTEKFKWHKKREIEEKMGLSEEEARERDRQRRMETITELEKLKKRRIERELEQAQHEAEMQRLQRERERELYGDLEAKENEFHLEQIKIRAQIRIREGRAKPIDILALSMNLDYTDVEIALDEPVQIFNDLPLEELMDLKNDIMMYLELSKDTAQQHLGEFWQAMLVICQDAIEFARGESQNNLPASVNEDIKNILRGKTLKQLQILQDSIVHKLASGESIDVEYWEALLKALLIYKARAQVREAHAEVVRKRLEILRQQQQEEAQRAREELEALMAAGVDEDGQGGHVAHPGAAQEGEINLDLDEEVYQQAPLSPQLLPLSIVEDDPRIKLVDPLEDWQALLAKREEVQANQLAVTTQQAVAMGLSAEAAAAAVARTREAVALGAAAPPEDSPAATAMALAFANNLGAATADQMVAIEAAKKAEPGELPFNNDVPVERQVYMWQDKYRPRKPRYFNRIHTGFDWNKYNQTHYDHDNPPPKTVQGYKFNIFYPDLIDKTVAPTYKILPDPDSPDGSTCIIRFHAGPPYEDIAFRIVNREWEQSHRRGFRCTFDRGILFLHFRFKRYRYRK